MSIQAGLTFEQTIRVDEALTVPAVSKAFTGFADMPPVFATAFMVGFIEWACIEALRGHLQPGEHTVGTLVDMNHVAATPVGGDVTAYVELVEVAGRKLRFRVSARDGAGLIGEGFHERAVINVATFLERTARRATA